MGSIIIKLLGIVFVLPVVGWIALVLRGAYRKIRYKESFKLNPLWYYENATNSLLKGSAYGRYYYLIAFVIVWTLIIQSIIVVTPEERLQKAAGNGVQCYAYVTKDEYASKCYRVLAHIPWGGDKRNGKYEFYVDSFSFSGSNTVNLDYGIGCKVGTFSYVEDASGEVWDLWLTTDFIEPTK